MKTSPKPWFGLVLILFGILIGFFLARSTPMLDLKRKSVVKTLLKTNNTAHSLWQNGYQKITIISSVDKKTQNAYFYPTTSAYPKPLVVSLHTWSGDYDSFDSLAILSKQKDVNYIHPSFRGPNKTREACLSQLALSDIDDAIDFAIAKGNVNTSQIHVIGKSGGGLAAIGAYMKSKHQLHTVSAWVPITDLAQWHTEVSIRQKEYAMDILKCTSSNNTVLDLQIANERSPINWPTPLEKRKNTRLLLYAGIYDGITGSVPISHSIDYYNKVLHDYEAKDSASFVSEKEELLLLKQKKGTVSQMKIDGRRVLLKKKYKKVQLCIFDGGHEMLTQFAFKALFENN